MKKATNKQPMRFERKYGNLLTVLEGRELENLWEAFVKEHQNALRKHKFEDAILIATAKAYQRLYGADVVCQSELKKCSTPDARKLDLFYRSVYNYFIQAIENGNKTKSDKKK